MKMTNETHPGCKCEFQIVGPKGVVFDSSIDDFVEKGRFAEKILRHTEP